MFGWLDVRTGWRLWWSYRFNRKSKPIVEDIFDGIAETRMYILKSWAEEYWGHLERLRSQITQHIQGKVFHKEQIDGSIRGIFDGLRSRAMDFSEIFLLDKERKVVFSTYTQHVGVSYRSENSLLQMGLDQAFSGEPCLFGPYPDRLTLEIGPSSSNFHDEMTLMYLLPIFQEREVVGVLCGRVPNDVIGDLIQRESGHVYPDSGDNYIFMAEARLLKHIEPGTALSRSRFEDHTFTHGENLKDGVTTAWGTVKVKQHTELELKFTDPATGKLHPGVANTIANGSNLFVEFPGYPDYRHIPVIGKGVTFQLPHCPDTWGMMCEADLEEVYRNRSIQLKMGKLQLWIVLIFMLANIVAQQFTAMANLSPWLSGMILFAVNLLCGYIGVAVLYKGGTRPVESLLEITHFIRQVAEGQGDLSRRLNQGQFENDETKDLAKWVNNFIDTLEGIMIKVKNAAMDVRSSQDQLDESTTSSERSMDRVIEKMDAMVKGLQRQLDDIETAKTIAHHMSVTLDSLEKQATEQIAVAQDEVEGISDKMNHIHEKVLDTNQTIRTFLETTEKIKDVLQVIEGISTETNLLALNASIEAARVGEYGRGFVVVASRIRQLANMTRESTTQISETITTIQHHATEAFASMESGTKEVMEGTEMVRVAKETLDALNQKNQARDQVVTDMVNVIERVADVSLQNQKISMEVEQTVNDLSADTKLVRNTSTNVVGTTDVMLHLVNQFSLSDRKK